LAGACRCGARGGTGPGAPGKIPKIFLAGTPGIGAFLGGSGRGCRAPGGFLTGRKGEKRKNGPVLSDSVQGLAPKKPRITSRRPRRDLEKPRMLWSNLDRCSAGSRDWHGICMPGVFSPQRRRGRRGRIRGTARRPGTGNGEGRKAGTLGVRSGAALRNSKGQAAGRRSEPGRAEGR